MLLKVLNDLRIGFLDPDARPIRDSINERAVWLDRHQQREIINASHFHVVRAKSGGNMDDACTIFGADKAAAIHDIGVVFIHGKITEHRLVVFAKQVRALHLLDDRVLLRVFEHLPDQRFRQNEAFSRPFWAILRWPFDHHVVDVLAYS